MQLDSDETVETSLLGPADNGPIMPLTLEEEAVLLGDEMEAQKAQEVTMPSPEYPETQNWRNQPSSLMFQVHLPLQPHPHTPRLTIPGIPREPRIGL